MTSSVAPVSLAGQHLLPIVAPLVPLFPEGGLRRGSTVVVTAGAGATSLAVAAAVAASQAGSWCAAVGLPALGMVAVAGLGMALERFALVPHPGSQWADVTAALIDAVDVLLLQAPRGIRASDARRLTARARERGVVLIVPGGEWASVVDLSLTVASVRWQGLGQGHGYLQGRTVEVTSFGRGAASRARRIQLWLPGDLGTVSPALVPVAAVVAPASAAAVG